MSKIVEITAVVVEVTDGRFVCVDFNKEIENAVYAYARSRGKVGAGGMISINTPLWKRSGCSMAVVRAYPMAKKAGYWHHSVKQYLNLVATVTVAIALHHNLNHETVIVMWFKSIRPYVPTLERSIPCARQILENAGIPLTIYEGTEKYIGSTPINPDMVETVV